MNLSKKVIVVTGSNRGIGNGILQLLCQTPNLKEKALILTSRNRDDGHLALENLKKEFPHAKDSLHYYQLDVAHGDSVKKFRHKLLEDFGHLDILFNNAATIQKNPPNDKEVKEKEIHHIFNTNVWGLINITEELLSYIKPGGQVVNISSQLGQMRFSKTIIDRFMDDSLHVDDLHKLFKEYHQAYTNNNLEKTGWDDKSHHYGCYAISKVFVNAYTRILDQRLKRNNVNIKVNAVSPGWCKTRMGGDNAPRGVLKGAEGIAWFETFTDEKNDDLSGNFYYDKKKISWI
jgi:NAD(P)-dependent dehydrogenase (short-subunit alcohol dehydrogenase family)